MTALEEFPRELSLSTVPRTTRKDPHLRYVLWIHGPGVSGQAISTSRGMALGIAEAYASMRRDQIAREVAGGAA